MNHLLLLGFALILMAGGLGLWVHSQGQERVQKVSARVERILDSEPADPLPAVAESRSTLIQQGLQSMPFWVQEAFSTKQLLWSGAASAVVALAVALLTVWWAVLIVLAMAVSVLFFIAWLRWQRTRRQMVRQLPAFVDGMVRMVVLGHAAPSAFVMAAASAKPPLVEVVTQAAALTKAGMPVDQALQAASRSYALQDFHLLASVIQVGTQFGGRVDSLLERVAAYMRDKEEASRELSALSAEVRVSAWVLCLLPVIVGGFIIVTNTGYFLKMWDDPSGRWVALSGVGLQIIGSICLYRLAKIDD